MHPYQINLQSKLKLDYLENFCVLDEKPLSRQTKNPENMSFSEFCSIRKKSRCNRGKSLSIQMPITTNAKIKVKTEPIECIMGGAKFLLSQHPPKTPDMILPRLHTNVKERFNFKRRSKRRIIQPGSLPINSSEVDLKNMYEVNPLKSNKSKVITVENDAGRNSYYYEKVKQYYENKYDWKHD